MSVVRFFLTVMMTINTALTVAEKLKRELTSPRVRRLGCRMAVGSQEIPRRRFL